MGIAERIYHGHLGRAGVQEHTHSKHGRGTFTAN